jgi:hypothetical protein
VSPSLFEKKKKKAKAKRDSKHKALSSKPQYLKKKKKDLRIFGLILKPWSALLILGYLENIALEFISQCLVVRALRGHCQLWFER